MPHNETSEPDLFGGLTLPPAKPTPSSFSASPSTHRPSTAQALSAHAHAVTSEPKQGHAFKSISEAADMLELPQHVLRFWETKFSQIRPIKLKGGRRYYRPEDIEILSTIKHLLYKQGYTIKGAKKAFTDARKHKDMPTQEKPARTKAAPVESTPLFMPLAPAAASMLDDRKRGELRAIQDELLQLRSMLTALPVH
jgi:DNA-binding transcriptional MerR regulator